MEYAFCDTIMLHVFACFPTVTIFYPLLWFLVFIPGIYMGNIPQTSLIFLPKKPSYQAKVSYLCSEKLSASPPDPPNRGSAPGPRWGTAPRPPSSGVNQSIGVYDIRIPTVFGRVVSKYYVQMCRKLQLLGDFFPQTLITLHLNHMHWGTSKVPIPQLP